MTKPRKSTSSRTPPRSSSTASFRSGPLAQVASTSAALVSASVTSETDDSTDFNLVKRACTDLSDPMDTTTLTNNTNIPPDTTAPHIENTSLFSSTPSPDSFPVSRIPVIPITQNTDLQTSPVVPPPPQVTAGSFLSFSIHAPSGKGKDKNVSFIEHAVSPAAADTALKTSLNKYYAVASHDPDAVKQDEETHSVFSLNIPLFISELQLRSAFSWYGNVAKCKMFTKKLYQNAIITFDSVEQINAFNDTWCAWCCSHCLRIVPCSYNADQHDLHHHHMALLAGLPKGTVAANLAPLIDELKGKSVAYRFS
ncbi:hypothetical protein RclHR1_20160003 [Rhizophagus clarus]|uniref:RRM domain-containing protein n=1 Tax=Rhizophagus clarus TaxID=94130 RepID=A0A2Z6R3A3_9GLOM|nr:hypothetical protein RclHR1_20160003 [Rhizophagus clarus]